MEALRAWASAFFDWPAGAVWGNVVAIIPCGLVGAIWGKRELLKHHREHMAKLDLIHTHLKQERNRMSTDHQFSPGDNVWYNLGPDGQKSNPALICELRNPNPAQYSVFDHVTHEFTVCGEGEVGTPGSVRKLG